MSPALALTHLAEVEALEAEVVRLRSALIQAGKMAKALKPDSGQPLPNMVATLGLSAIFAVTEAALENP
jgi:hypothetical protein